MTDDTATLDMHKVREVAMACLRGPPDLQATSPAYWCQRANVDLDTFVAWDNEHGSAFRTWFFREINPLSPMAKRARDVRFWAAMDRSLDVAAPNASILKLYAEIMGLVGRNAIPVTDPENEDDTEAWAMVEALPLPMLRILVERAEAREAERRALPVGDKT